MVFYLDGRKKMCYNWKKGNGKGGRRDRVSIRMKQCAALFLAGAMVVSVLAGCGNTNDDTEGILANDVAGEYYTLRLSLEESPSDWNPHTREEDCVFQGLCELGFVDIGVTDDGAGYRWIYEMASDIRDITEEFAEKEKFGIASGEMGRVYQIDLNEEACWEDGTEINADSYIYSMQQMLDPEMKNGQADKYLTGECAIANAWDYYNNDGSDTETVWDDVGLIKSGDYQLIYITASAVSQFSFLMNMTSNWLVKQDLYENGKQTGEDRVTTDYGASPDCYMSYGPYRIVSFEPDNRLILKKNEAWYGWSDGKHVGQYQADRIIYNIIGNHADVLQQFIEGRLDQIILTPDDVDIYGLSDFLVKEEQTAALGFLFTADVEVLETLEESAGDGTNKRVLTYRDFRKAFSLAIDRIGFCGQATAAYEPACALVNSSYYSDMETFSFYRDSKEAKQAVLDLYGIEYTDDTIEERYTAVTGYDVETARALLENVYEQAIADGNYSEGQEIHIDVMVSAAAELSADEKKQEELLNRYMAEAAEDTGFEGKIKITFLSGSQTRYEDLKDGKIEAISAAEEEEAGNPYRLMLHYTDSDTSGSIESVLKSCGWDSAAEELEISWDFDGDGTMETKSDTFLNWAKAVSDGTYAGDGQASLTILARLETGILDTYLFLPYASVTVAGLYSQKISYEAERYNMPYSVGGIRFIGFNYTDEEWKEYVSSGNLSYE